MGVMVMLGGVAVALLSVVVGGQLIGRGVKLCLRGDPWNAVTRHVQRGLVFWAVAGLVGFVLVKAVGSA